MMHSCVVLAPYPVYLADNGLFRSLDTIQIKRRRQVHVSGRVRSITSEIGAIGKTLADLNAALVKVIARELE
jgi:hypothetical protein